MDGQLHFGVSDQGFNAFAPEPSSVIFSASLVNGAASSITLPENYPAWIISFSVQPGTNVWVNFQGTTATVPAGATFASSSSELNPGARLMSTFENDGITPKTISVITSNAMADVAIVLYGVKFAN